MYFNNVQSYVNINVNIKKHPIICELFLFINIIILLYCLT